MNALEQLTRDLPPEDRKAANDVVEGVCRLAARGVVTPDGLDIIMQALSEELAESWASRHRTG